MRQWRRWAAASVTAMALATTVACGKKDSTAPAIDSPAGTWTGTTNGITLKLDLRDLAGDIRGSGSLTSGTSTSTFTVLGGEWSDNGTIHSLSLTFASASSATVPLGYTCTTQAADECDGPVVFSDGNSIFFTIKR